MRGFLLLLLASLAGCAPASGGEPDGARLYFDTCASCHSADGRGSDRGPALTTEAAGFEVDEIVDVILDGEGLMNPVELSIEEAEAVATFVHETLLP